jgi:hypothetical protein
VAGSIDIADRNQTARLESEFESHTLRVGSRLLQVFASNMFRPQPAEVLTSDNEVVNCDCAIAQRSNCFARQVGGLLAMVPFCVCHPLDMPGEADGFPSSI